MGVINTVVKPLPPGVHENATVVTSYGCSRAFVRVGGQVFVAGHSPVDLAGVSSSMEDSRLFCLITGHTHAELKEARFLQQHQRNVQDQEAKASKLRALAKDAGFRLVPIEETA